MPSYDTAAVTAALDEAERLFHELFDGQGARSHVERFTSHLNTVRMVVDLSATEASKEQ